MQERESLLRSVLRRAVVVLASTLVLSGFILLTFQSVSALMRTHHELRFLVTPGNAIVSAVQALGFVRKVDSANFTYAIAA
ncbi:DUF1705 domain-containing protein [Chromohalobacter salexigens]|nr:DUF1705 domain-containing protein [Chromohalobacter salexigens]